MDGKSDILKAVRARLASFDDDALAALANKGLLRRAQKDLEEAPTVLGDEDGKLRLQVGDAIVEVTESINNSRCNCPAAGVCRHILSALIYLRDSGDPEEQEKPEPVACAEEILAIDDEALRKWAGRPLIRRATERLARELQVDIEDSSPIIFTIPALNASCRWMPGGGLEGMVCSCHAPSVCEHRVCAVLAYQAAKGGRKLEEEVRPLEASTGAPRTRQEVLNSVGMVVREMLMQGLSRLSSATEQRLRTLAVSAHGVDLPRLERMLRSLADETRLYIARDAQADSRSLLIAASRIEALRVAMANPTAALIGEHKSTYDPVGTVELIGMGARRWRSRSGYAGLTLYFWDVSRSNWATWTDARPISVGEFDAVMRYQQDGPWTGCPSPAKASKSVIRLNQAWRNRSGRLSGRPGTTATVTGDSDPKTFPAGIASWSDLLDKASRLFGEGFSERSEQDGIVYLTPAGAEKPEFDKIRQELVWPIYDSEGRAIPVVLPHTPENAGAITTIENSWKSASAGVLGLLKLWNGRLAVEPISLYGKSGIINLTLDSAPPSKGKLAKLIKAITDEEDNDVSEDAIADNSSTPIGLLIGAMESEMERIAEGGTSGWCSSDRLRMFASKAESIGLLCCSKPVSQAADRLDGSDKALAAEALLKAYYVCRVTATQELLMGMVEGG